MRYPYRNNNMSCTEFVWYCVIVLYQYGMKTILNHLIFDRTRNCNIISAITFAKTLFILDVHHQLRSLFLYVLMYLDIYIITTPCTLVYTGTYKLLFCQTEFQCLIRLSLRRIKLFINDESCTRIINHYCTMK